MITEVDPNRIEPSIICADTWPRQKLDAVRMNAYRELEKAGMIRIQRVRYSHSVQLVAVEYLSTVPIEWARDLLRETYGNLVQFVKKEEPQAKPESEQIEMQI